MAVRTVNTQATDWHLEEASEVLEFREKEDGLREFRHHTTLVVSRNIDGLSSWKSTGAIVDIQASGELTGVTIGSSDVPNASDDVYSNGQIMTFLGVDPAAGVANYATLVKISDIMTPEGPKGGKFMRQTQEWVAVSNWADYEYDEA